METLPSLAEMLTHVPDRRQQSKVQHPLSVLLLHAVLAVLCGCRGPTAIAEWGRLHPALAVDLGYAGDASPCAATFCRVFACLDWEMLVQVLQRWAESWVLPKERRRSGRAAPRSRLALDGKTLRGSRKRGGRNCHVLTAVFHEIGLTLSEAAVDDKTNEIPVAEELLKRLRLKNRVVTVDALLTQRAIAQTIVERHGDYVMPVKDNHEAVRKELDRLFGNVRKLEVSVASAKTCETSRDRMESRRITVLGPSETWGDQAFAEYFQWPGLARVYRLERDITDLKTRRTTHVVEVGFTSLSAAEADAATLLAMRRGHWHIENALHHVRDVTYDEDRSQVHLGSAPQVHATLRNVAIALCRRHGHTNIAQANREFAAKPQRALAWLGINRS